jgi:phosphoribosylaminoimidazole (AIR) synthetase
MAYKIAYANLKMGAGFALYMRESDVVKLLSIAHSLGLSALRAGTVPSSKIKKVIINPLGLECLGSTLGVR